MNYKVSTIERAYQLAEQSASVDEVRGKLKKENYTSVDAHLTGRKIRSDLTAILSRRA